MEPTGHPGGSNEEGTLLLQRGGGADKEGGRKAGRMEEVDVKMGEEKGKGRRKGKG